jgi:hypothetical protein
LQDYECGPGQDALTKSMLISFGKFLIVQFKLFNEEGPEQAGEFKRLNF